MNLSKIQCDIIETAVSAFYLQIVDKHRNEALDLMRQARDLKHELETENVGSETEHDN